MIFIIAVDVGRTARHSLAEVICILHVHSYSYQQLNIIISAIARRFTTMSDYQLAAGENFPLVPRAQWGTICVLGGN